MNRAHATLSDVQTRVAQTVANRTAKQEEEAVEREKDLDVARENAAAAGEELELATQKLMLLKARFEAEDRREQLLDFVRRRAASEDYRSELGFIAQVRRDFDELNRLMYLPDPPAEDATGQDFARELKAFLTSLEEDDLNEEELARPKKTVKAPEASERQAFERIVLYIDDLDRCPPAQVILVLQAIHLLLAYPLFVVFVAVDVRWLENALEETYPQFNRDVGPALPEPSDYLEKIFQIPYWVRPMSSQGTAAFMGDVLGHRSTVKDSGGRAATDAHVEDDDAVAKSTEASATPAIEVPKLVRLTQPIGVTDEERSFLEKRAPGLDGSPRRILRFVNSYRLIKASLSVADRRRLDNGGYRGLLTLLAIQITLPGVFDDIASDKSVEENDSRAALDEC